MYTRLRSEIVCYNALIFYLQEETSPAKPESGKEREKERSKFIIVNVLFYYIL